MYGNYLSWKILCVEIIYYGNYYAWKLFVIVNILNENYFVGIIIFYVERYFIDILDIKKFIVFTKI